MNKSINNKFTFKSWQDILLFTWVIVVACLVSTVASQKTIAFVYFFLGAYTSLVCCIWVKRNKENWKKIKE